MATELGHSQLEDPLRDSSLPSLLRKTLGAPSHSEIAASEDQELESIKNLLKSVVGKGSSQLVQQAQTITKSYTDIHTLYSEDGSFAANCKDRPPERRPALGRKRAKFSLKPVPSNSLPNIDFSSSIDHIDDPEEYFSAFEQLENAEKELKKLRGEVSTDAVQPHQCTTVRKRRHGLLGKTASYKHHTSASGGTEILVESQEEYPCRRIPSSSNTSIDTRACNSFHPEPVDEPGFSQAKNTNSELRDATESEGSVAEKEKNISSLLEKLLSSFQDFDGDEGKNFLRENLQMKSIDAGKIRLPELGNIQLSQHSMLKNRATRGESKGSQVSPPLTNSLLKAISAIHRRVSLKDPLKDIYSAFPSDDAPSSGDYSLSKSVPRESLSPAGAGNHDVSDFLFHGASSSVGGKGTRLDFEDESCSPVVEADRSIGNNIIIEERMTKHLHPLLERNTNPGSNGVVNDKGNVSDGFDGGLQEGNDIQLDPVITDQPNAGVEGPMLSCSIQPRREEILDHPSQLPGENTSCEHKAGDKDKDLAGGLDGGLQVEGDNMQQDLLITDQTNAGVEVLTSSCVNQTITESLSSPPSRNMSGNCRSSGTNFKTGFSGEDIMQCQVNATVHEKLSDAETSNDILSPREATVLTDQHLKNIHSLPEENEEHQAVSGPSPNEGRKSKATPRTRNKKKSTPGRKSLASAGMVWVDGRRKSSRRRFRPLEHWRGEKLLYARIHESLSTVIGVKYASPGKDTFKVESYVSEEYAGLVAQVSRC